MGYFPNYWLFLVQLVDAAEKAFPSLWCSDTQMRFEPLLKLLKQF